MILFHVYNQNGEKGLNMGISSFIIIPELKETFTFYIMVAAENN